VIDDDPDICAVLREVLVDDGFEVDTTESALGVMPLARERRPAVIILDLGLPLKSGAALLSQLKSSDETAGIPAIVLSGMPDILSTTRSDLAYAVLSKPFDSERLLKVVREASQLPGSETSAC
jgi:DNA-binding NtrC family response regulator